VVARDNFSTPIQTGPGTQPAFCAMGTRALSWGIVARAWLINHPPPSDSKVGNR